MCFEGCCQHARGDQCERAQLWQQCSKETTTTIPQAVLLHCSPLECFPYRSCEGGGGGGGWATMETVMDTTFLNPCLVRCLLLLDIFFGTLNHYSTHWASEVHQAGTPHTGLLKCIRPALHALGFWSASCWHSTHWASKVHQAGTPHTGLLKCIMLALHTLGFWSASGQHSKHWAPEVH